MNFLNRNILLSSLIIVLSIGLFATMYVLNETKDTRTEASEINGETTQQNSAQYVPNEVIVKLKQKLPDNLDATKTTSLRAQGDLSSQISSDTQAPEVLKKVNAKRKIRKINAVIPQADTPLETMKKKEAQIKSTQNVYIPQQAKEIPPDLTTLYKITVEEGSSVEDVIAELKKDPNVVYAQPNYIMKLEQTLPNDPEFWRQREFHNNGLNNDGTPNGRLDFDIDAPEAWAATASDTRNVIVALIDTGVDQNHPDLAGIFWNNTREITGNNIDDDQNGFIDDITGWNFVANNNNPMDDVGHGTHIAGIMAAVRNNNIGIAGVSKNIRIMNLKSHDPFGCTVEQCVQGVQYAVRNGALVINASWGITSPDIPAYTDAVEFARAHGVLFVASSGNASRNNDVQPHQPSSVNKDNVIGVAALDRDFTLMPYSNYGQNSVHIATFGLLYSTKPNNSYGLETGTSMAAPQVSAAAAMAFAHFPNANYRQIREYIFQSSVTKDVLNGKIIGSRVLNLQNLVSLPPPPSVTPIPSPVHNMQSNHDGNAGAQLFDSNNCKVYGWASDPDDRTRKVDIRIFVNGVLKTTMKANNQLRPDLPTSVCPDGNCGFTQSLTNWVGVSEPTQIRVDAYDAQIAQWKPLNNSPKTISCAFPTPTPVYLTVSAETITTGTNETEVWQSYNNCVAPAGYRYPAPDEVLLFDVGGRLTPFDKCAAVAPNKPYASYNRVTPGQVQIGLLDPPFGYQCDKWEYYHKSGSTNILQQSGTGCRGTITAQNNGLSHYVKIFVKPLQVTPTPTRTPTPTTGGTSNISVRSYVITRGNNTKVWQNVRDKCISNGVSYPYAASHRMKLNGTDFLYDRCNGKDLNKPFAINNQTPAGSNTVRMVNPPSGFLCDGWEYKRIDATTNTGPTITSGTGCGPTAAINMPFIANTFHHFNFYIKRAPTPTP